MDGIKISQGLGLQDFDLIRVIGRGSYAKVLLVRLKKNDQMYAMKVVKKELVHDDEVRPGAGAPSPWDRPCCLPLQGEQEAHNRFTVSAIFTTALWAPGASAPAISVQAVSTPRGKPHAHQPQPPAPTPSPSHRLGYISCREGHTPCGLLCPASCAKCRIFEVLPSEPHCFLCLNTTPSYEQATLFTCCPVASVAVTHATECSRAGVCSSPVLGSLEVFPGEE